MLGNLHWSNVIKPADRFSLNVGIAANYFVLAKDFSLEPRVSLKWEPDAKNSFALQRLRYDKSGIC